MSIVKRAMARYEQFLRIPPDGPAEMVMRMRAIWLIGSMFVLTQVCNLGVMSWSYGGWTYDHTITVIAMGLVFATIQMVRWCKNKFFYAAFYSTLILLAILASALPEGTGINSALIPFLALGPVINGLIAGRRAAWVFAIVGALYFTFLLHISLSHPAQTIAGTHAREINRYAQAMFALSLSTVMSVMLSERVYSAIADLRQSAERARRAEAAKSEFLATMSHELRTPLNGVIGLTDALLNAQLPDHERHLTRTIRQSGESLLLILNDLLDLSKIEAGKLSIDPRPFDLNDVVRSVIDGWRAAATAKGLTLSASVTGDLPPAVIGDDLRLRQILQNLVSNAIKFTAAGAISVGVDVQRTAAGMAAVEVRVTDTGKGIPPDLVNTVFEAFEQGERGTTRQFGGTGLGLPICRMLAELMGGSVDIEETSPHGTTFLVRLILAPTAALRAGAECTDVQGRSLEGLRILVAEDNEVNRLVMREFLRKWGAAFTFAEDGLAAVRLAEAGQFDLILMDKHMPGLNGADATRAIRAMDGEKARTPIIAVTADAMTGEREVMLTAGMNDFVSKPVRAENLRSAILRVLNKSLAA